VFRQYADTARFAYNFAKKISDTYFAYTGESLTLNDLQKTFTVIKQTKAYGWLKDVNAQVPKLAARDYDKARKASFKNKGHSFGTNFKSKRKTAPKFRVEQFSFFKCDKKEINITSIGKVRTSRRLPRTKKLRNLRIQFNGVNWVMSYSFEHEVDRPSELSEKVIGIDDGLSSLVTCSNGMEFDSVRFSDKYKRHEKLKTQYARQMSKRYQKHNQKGKPQSKRYVKAKDAHARHSKKMSDMRSTYNHQVSRAILNTMPKAVVVEDKSLKFMIKNPKQAKAVMSQGINQLMRFLEYKAESQGTIFQKAPRGFASSKICHCCGYKYNDMDYEIPWGLAVREWVCVGCGAVHDRDFNAAKNLEYCFKEVI